VTALGSDASFALPDGRVVEYWEGGDPAGRPMIMHPGTPATRWLGRWGHEAAVSAGVRLVSLSRPGYGGSTAITEAPSLRAWGTDTAALASQLGMNEYVVFGISGGGPFAVATALADPRAVRALGIVSGVGPWRLLDDPSKYPEDRECLALLDAGDVAGSRACILALAEKEWSGLRALDDDARVDAVLAGEDSPLVHDEGYRAIWADNMRVVLDGLDGYVFDNLAWGGTWDVDPAEVSAPTLLWYGSVEDGLLFGHWYADRIADAELVIQPGEGHLDVCDSHWPEVLAGLLRIWR
jgi:pimeloyl-ACP methyl ester carboxylesterase